MATDSSQLARLRDTPCAVCGDWECDDDVEGDDPDPVVCCVDCGLVVHAQCYGYGYIEVPAKVKKIKGLDSDADKAERLHHAIQNRFAFRCQLCRDGVKQAACLLCGCHSANRSMKRLASKESRHEYAHIACVLWTPGPRFSDSEQKDGVIDVGKIEQARYKLRCIVCESQGRRSGGAPLQCSTKSCRIAYHILCNMEQGWDHCMEATETGLSVTTYCGKHSRPVPVLTEMLDEVACEVCAGIDRPASMILCDSCGHGFHIDCLQPQLPKIPDDEWFCKTCKSSSSVPLEQASKKRKRIQPFFKSATKHVYMADNPPLPSASPKTSLGMAGSAESARQRFLMSIGDKSTYYVLSGSGNVMEAAFIFARLIAGSGDVIAEINSDEDQSEVSVFIVPSPSVLRDADYDDGRKYVFVCSTSEQIVEYRELLEGRPFFLIDANDFSCEDQVQMERKEQRAGVEVQENALEWVISSFTVRIRQVLALFLRLAEGQEMQLAGLRDAAFAEMTVRTDQEWKNHMAELTDHKIVEVQGERILLLKSRSHVQAALKMHST